MGERVGRMQLLSSKDKGVRRRGQRGREKACRPGCCREIKKTWGWQWVIGFDSSKKWLIRKWRLSTVGGKPRLGGGVEELEVCCGCRPFLWPGLHKRKGEDTIPLLSFEILHSTLACAVHIPLGLILTPWAWICLSLLLHFPLLELFSGLGWIYLYVV